MRETRGKKAKKSRGTSLLVLILLILIVVAGVLFVMKISEESGKTGETGNGSQTLGTQDKPKEELKPKTLEGNERPIAFMLDNNINAMPQAGLIEADLVYEIIVEGGETRLMAVMKNKEVEKIGPLRSARHYFLDYALENDAIYVHYGQSPQAKSDIKTLGISDINGINESETNFWRVKDRYAPHNAVTSTEKIKKIIQREDFRTTTSKGNVLNYVVEEVELEAKKDEPKEGETEGKITNLANKVTIPYSSYNTVKYEYDEQSKSYIRYSRNKKQVDWDTQEAITVKNIIITKCKNTTLNDGTTKGRQTISNIKKLDGYYITNGKYIPITCEKTSRSGKTVYKDLEGNEIKVNDGKTFIQICPIDSKISFE